MSPAPSTPRIGIATSGLAPDLDENADLLRDALARAGVITWDYPLKLDAFPTWIRTCLDSGLSMATVSYRLGILRRADLVTKTRRGRQVSYQRTARATALFGDQPE